ncbi:hypothetical protein OG206_00475 [Streptomyces sp. NBC_01341]|uniref:hypothetical protein n=1 Tax=Streptomyces sp. NBC_01341 TaxID=2903831 RepID=UPI002E106778|nr:hypothetical protein OG206_00475 [Streptomyces sp. NBC_01341]
MISRATARFVSGQRATADWYGWDDDFAKEIGPKTEQENRTVIATGESLEAAVYAVTHGTLANLENINRTQGANIEAIKDESKKTGRH